MQWHLRSKRKATGGLLKRTGKKKRRQRGRDFIPVHIGKAKAKPVRMRGGSTKLAVLSSDVANVITKGKTQKVKILSVVENRADSQFVRRNVITKGAIIQTDIGKARVTSRPGQHGAVNAVLLEEKEKKA